MFEMLNNANLAKNYYSLDPLGDCRVVFIRCAVS